MKAWKYALAFSAGALISSIVTLVLTKRKYESIADKEIDEVKKYYLKKRMEDDKKLNEIIGKSEELDKKIEEKILTDAEIKDEKKVAETGDLKPSNTRQTVNYNNIYGKTEEKMAEKEAPEEEKPTKPYLITEDEYLNDDDNEKLALTYYAYDDTLADDMNEPVDIEETISSDIYNEIIDANEDIFVRNPILETDYEIMRVEGSYAERYY